MLMFFLFSDDFNHIVMWTVLGLAVSGVRLWAVPPPVNAAYTHGSCLPGFDRKQAIPRVEPAPSMGRTLSA